MLLYLKSTKARCIHRVVLVDVLLSCFSNVGVGALFRRPVGRLRALEASELGVGQLTGLVIG